MRQEKLERDFVVNIEKLLYLTLPPSNIQTLRLKEIDPNPYFFDKKTGYISLDKQIKAESLAAYAN